MQNEIINQIKAFLISKTSATLIIVFGSFAKGLTHSASDIDIAFYSKDKTFSDYDIFMLAQELAGLLKLEVDLVNLKKASTVFQSQIFSSGKVIYSIDEPLRMNIEMLAFSMYAKLNEERKVILDNVKESGSIHDK
ncbi:MAG: nucleotidyltransferase domain-containing protein [Bacillota bacterium]|nr:nucleotidyltransferase domain-containing protein [Bacillota bacterium]